MAGLTLMAAGFSHPASAVSADDQLRNGSFEQFEVVKDHRRRKEVRLSQWGTRDTSGFGPGAEVGQIEPSELGAETLSKVWTADIGAAATDGDYKIELDAGTAVDALLQDFPSQADSVYTLSFDAYRRRRDSSDIEVWVDGRYRNTVSASGSRKNNPKTARSATPASGSTCWPSTAAGSPRISAPAARIPPSSAVKAPAPASSSTVCAPPRSTATASP